MSEPRERVRMAPSGHARTPDPVMDKPRDPSQTPSPKTHVFIGMYRPTEVEILDLIDRHMADFHSCCPFGHKCKFKKSWPYMARNCWRAGCFDSPVYMTIRDLVGPIHQAVIASMDKADELAKRGVDDELKRHIARREVTP
jgi:hypothetical protein